jgi:hypothetical protein
MVMSYIFILLSLVFSYSVKADFLCDLEYQKVGCKKDDAQCLISQLARIEKKCHAEVSRLLLESAQKDPCFKVAQKCASNVTSECLKDSPPECQKHLLDQEKNSKLLEKECDFSEIEKNCPMDKSGGLGDIQKQMACFSEHKHKLSPSCLNIIEQIGK